MFNTKINEESLTEVSKVEDWLCSPLFFWIYKPWLNDNSILLYALSVSCQLQQ